MTRTFAAAFVVGLGAAPAGAVDATMQITLPGDVQHLSTTYECGEDFTPRTVEYINAAPNFLAILTIADERLLFVSTISASGVRYVSGSHVWWTSGAEATLVDEMDGPDAEPLTCLEITNIP